MYLCVNIKLNIMKAQELRIGNYVYDEGDLNNPIQVVSIQEDNTEWLKPIPLTEQWLLDFGFKKFGKNTFYLGKILIHHRKRGFVIAKRYSDILYVNELQNLYYVLTKKELTLCNTQKNN